MLQYRCLSVGISRNTGIQLLFLAQRQRQGVRRFSLYDYFSTLWCLAHLVTSLSGVWRQADGTLLSWSPWWATLKDVQGEPSGGKAENCADVILDESTLAGQWRDAACSSAKYYVCERGF